MKWLFIGSQSVTSKLLPQDRAPVQGCRSLPSPENLFFPSTAQSSSFQQLRHVRLRRKADGSLGFSIKGGTDHNLPILVSKVCRSRDEDHLYIGDAVLKGT